MPSGRHRPSDQQRGHLLPDETYCTVAWLRMSLALLAGSRAVQYGCASHRRAVHSIGRYLEPSYPSRGRPWLESPPPHGQPRTSPPRTPHPWDVRLYRRAVYEPVAGAVLTRRR